MITSRRKNSTIFAGNLIYLLEVATGVCWAGECVLLAKGGGSGHALLPAPSCGGRSVELSSHYVVTVNTTAVYSVQSMIANKSKRLVSARSPASS